MACVLWVWFGGCPAPGAAECIVVRVVVNDRTDGAGEEKVLSTPRPTLTPTVPVVPWAEEGA